MRAFTFSVIVSALSLTAFQGLAAKKPDYCAFGRQTLAIHWITNGKIEGEEARDVKLFFHGLWRQLQETKHLGTAVQIIVYPNKIGRPLFDDCNPGCPKEKGFNLGGFFSSRCEPMIATKQRENFGRKLVGVYKTTLNKVHRPGTDIMQQLSIIAKTVPQEKEKGSYRTDIVIGKLSPSGYIEKSSQNSAFDAAFVRLVQDNRVLPPTAKNLSLNLSLKCTGEIKGTGAFWRDVFELSGHSISIDCN